MNFIKRLFGKNFLYAMLVMMWVNSAFFARSPSLFINAPMAIRAIVLISIVMVISRWENISNFFEKLVDNSDNT